jgi:hypothetical protein
MELMTIEDAVKFFKVKDRRTIDNWLYTGALPRNEVTTKIGNKVYFIKEKLEQFIRKGTA